MKEKERFEKMFNELIEWLKQKDKDIDLRPTIQQRLFENTSKVWLTFEEEYIQWTPLEKVIKRIYFLNPLAKINKGKIVAVRGRSETIEEDEKLTRELNDLLLKIWNKE